jgi:peroxiredoxin Q/BCP
VRLSEELAKGPVVLFFYPKAMTPGCTAESCHFRDLTADFAALCAQPIGISADPIERQQAFSEKHSLGFLLLSDTDRAVARAYGVKRPGPIFNKRETFVIAGDGRVLAIINAEFATDRHADEALAVLRAGR